MHPMHLAIECTHFKTSVVCGCVITSLGANWETLDPMSLHQSHMLDTCQILMFKGCVNVTSNNLTCPPTDVDSQGHEAYTSGPSSSYSLPFPQVILSDRGWTDRQKEESKLVRLIPSWSLFNGRNGPGRRMEWRMTVTWIKDNTGLLLFALPLTVNVASVQSVCSLWYTKFTT